MTTDVVSQHPVLACARRVADAVKDVADVQPVFMTTSDKQAALVELARAEAQVAELRLRVLAASGEVGVESGARDAAAWVSHATQADSAAARADLHLANALDARETVAAGLREGRVSVAQARVITRGLDALPPELGPDLLRSAEETLVGYCAHHRPVELRRLARRILDVVAPEVAEAELAKQLEAEEARARDTASLRFRPLGDGRTALQAIFPDTTVGRLKTYLDAFTSPRHDPPGSRDGRSATSSTSGDASTSGGSDIEEVAQQPSRDARTGGEADRIPLYRKRAHAFIALLEHLDPDALPTHGGDATTVVVTIGIEDLRSDLATAGLLDGEEISAEQARRLACTAAILPAVLDGKGHVLDLGRTRRLFSAAQRKALNLRDQRCRGEGCTIPAKWCEAHHLIPWSHGGKTDLADAVNLCSWHHHRIHDHTFTHNRLPNGDIRFHRRT